MSSQSFASELVANLVALGVKHFYLSPGSRSQALALAAYSMEEAEEASLTVRIDERSMAFSALGRAMVTQAPVALITTSGTAVANLHPAVLEAHHAGVPLILLTADRPAFLRGKGANQTTNQVGIFSDAVRLCVDADETYDAADLARRAVDTAISEAGPVHLNLQFVEPLSSEQPLASEIYENLTNFALETQPTNLETVTLSSSEKTVVIAGAGSTNKAAEFAEKFALPIFAEPSSGSRHSKNAVLRYAELLQLPLATSIEQVVVFGKPTLNRSVTKLIQTCNQVQVVRNKKFGHFDTASNAKNFADDFTFDSPASAQWLSHWQSSDAELPEPEGFSRAQIVRAVWQATTESDAVVLGASKLIREADRFATREKIQVFSNRGLAGIDGTASTAIGIAQETDGVTRVLMGDLTFLHDIGGLNLTGVGNINLQLIVVNDHGGKIFEQLEIRDSAPNAAFEKLFRTPQQFAIDDAAKAFGWNYIKVSNQTQLKQALEIIGATVIEIELD